MSLKQRMVKDAMGRSPVNSGAIPGLVGCIAGTHYSGRRELRNCDVVRVAVSTVRAKRDDHMRSNTPDFLNDCGYGSSGIDLVDSSIGVAEDKNVTNPKHSGGGSKFRFTHAADLSRFSLSVR